MSPTTAVPTSLELVQAMRLPERALAKPLRQFKAQQNPVIPGPFYAQGSYGVVFFGELGARRVALKFFTSPPADLRERYMAIRSHFSTTRPTWMIDFDWHDVGIQINGRQFPVVAMDHAAGERLDKWVDRNISEPSRVAELAERWRRLCADMFQHEYAHGDLQVGNVMVREDGSIVLVDLEGSWVPSLRAKRAVEQGHVAFQHPERGSAKPYHKHFDLFSQTVIYASLLAVSQIPELWSDCWNEENLIFTPDDFRDQSRAIWARVEQIGDPTCSLAIRCLRGLCGDEGAPRLTRSLEDLLTDPPTLRQATSRTGSEQLDRWWTPSGSNQPNTNASTQPQLDWWGGGPKLHTPGVKKSPTGSAPAAPKKPYVPSTKHKSGRGRAAAGLMVVLAVVAVLWMRGDLRRVTDLWPRDDDAPAEAALPAGDRATTVPLPPNESAPPADTVSTPEPLPPVDLPNGVFGLLPLADKPVLQPGDSGFYVEYLQSVLQLKAEQSGVAITGVFDEPTGAAVRNIQRFFGLDESGMVDQATWEAVDLVASQP